MLRKRYLIAALAGLLAGAPAAESNDVVMLPIATALNGADGQQSTLQNVRVFFGGQPTPPIAHVIGTFTAHRKTNGFARSEAFSCDWAFLAAVRELQSRAMGLGGNAVVHIISAYNRHLVSSPTDYECHKGLLMAGVVLRGEVVRLGTK